MADYRDELTYQPRLSEPFYTTPAEVQAQVEQARLEGRREVLKDVAKLLTKLAVGKGTGVVSVIMFRRNLEKLYPQALDAGKETQGT